MPKKLEINYNDMRLNDPKTFVEYAKKLNELFTADGVAISNVKFVFGQRCQNNPRIFFNKKVL